MNPQILIGKTEEEAKILIEESGFYWCVTKRDDRYFVVTMDYRMSRINLEIEDRIVVSANIG